MTMTIEIEFLRDLQQQVAELQAKVSALVTPSPTPNFNTKHGIYTDTNDIDWITLVPADSKVGGVGNALIITKNVLLAGTPYHEGNKFVDFDESTLKGVMDDWVADGLAGEIFDIHLPAKFDRHEILPDGDGDVLAFPLSLTEVDKYLSDTDYIESANLHWWLRSPGSSASNPVRIVNSFGNIPNANAVNATTTIGVRPALWVSVKD